jgi:hypothetical protein
MMETGALMSVWGLVMDSMSKVQFLAGRTGIILFTTMHKLALEHTHSPFQELWQRLFCWGKAAEE